MDRTDKAIHEVYQAIQSNDLKWNDFPSIGLSEAFYLWYYAENRLYIIRDCMTDMFYFVEAGNPEEAFRVFATRLDEATKAGEWCQEEWDE
jgi:hypothetical protein